MEAIEFLGVIYGDIKGYVNIVTMDPLDGEDTVKSKFVEWPAKRDFAQRYLSMRDTCPPSEFEVEPSLVVRTSRNRTHCWWILDTPHPLAECSEVARSIYQKHRDKGCDSGWQTSKLLRVPGSVNTKYGADYPVRVVENTGAVYTLDEIKAAYPVVRLEEAKNPRCAMTSSFALSRTNSRLIHFGQCTSTKLRTGVRAGLRRPRSSRWSYSVLRSPTTRCTS